jgi:branched-subunit amino acid aminotransferase/4-amino-4-deoxychorismate lyase
MVSMFLRFMRDEAMVEFLLEMAELQAQGYLRPFTVDEEQSIGVTFPNDPSIRAVVCRYDQYLGEPFSGVVVPHYVRACCANGTGCLKLGVNYVISLKAVDEAKKILPEAASALLLDDRPFDPVEKRKITEWDSSCCLFALRDGTVIKIPESPLILPSVTIQGIVAILKLHGVKVEERDMTYGELVERTKKNGMVVVCSVGTAGILNRAQKLVLVNEARKIIAEQRADVNHELYQKLGEARKYYWDIYKEKVEVPPGLTMNKYEL